MTTFLVALIIGIACGWLARHYLPEEKAEIVEVENEIRDHLKQRALELVKEINDADAGGEWKHHVVLGRLVKEFQDVGKHEINKAILWAVDKL